MLRHISAIHLARPQPAVLCAPWPWLDWEAASRALFMLAAPSSAPARGSAQPLSWCSLRRSAISKHVPWLHIGGAVGRWYV